LPPPPCPVGCRTRPAACGPHAPWPPGRRPRPATGRVGGGCERKNVISGPAGPCKGMRHPCQLRIHSAEWMPQGGDHGASAFQKRHKAARPHWWVRPQPFASEAFGLRQQQTLSSSRNQRASHAATTRRNGAPSPPPRRRRRRRQCCSCATARRAAPSRAPPQDAMRNQSGMPWKMGALQEQQLMGEVHCG
jgi:hypothetical protein